MRLLNIFKQDTYLQFNIICAGIIFLMMIYFGIFSTQGIGYPISSMYDSVVPSTGLSRSFSAILHLDFNEANRYNSYGIALFIFFAVQLFLRIFLSIFLFNNRYSKKVILFVDLLLTVLLFLPTFGNYIYNGIK